jgi:hypothetical protein
MIEKITRKKINYITLVDDIFTLSEKYKNDLLGVNLNFKDFYNFVKSIPFQSDGIDSDGKELEILHRPSLILNKNNISCDCDDKTLLVGSYCKLNKIAFQIGVSGINKKPSHIFPIVFDGNQLIPYDATYEENRLGIIYPKDYDLLQVFFEKTH